MKSKSVEKGSSIWITTFPVARRPALGENVEVDVCVIGAGIAGLTTGYLLATSGRSVAILDDGDIGGGMSGFTTAHLTHALDDRYDELERLHGPEGAALAAMSHTAAIDRIENIVAIEKIECDFRRLDGFLFGPPGDRSDDIEKEYEAAHRAGLTDVEVVERAPIEAVDTRTALRFPNQGQFHPVKYLSGLANAIERNGGRIYCGTHAAEVKGGDNAHVKTAHGHVVRAAAIVVATNVPINDRLVIHTKQAPYTTYVIGVEVPAGAVSPALYWDTRQSAEDHSHQAPYHYVRLYNGAGDGAAPDILIAGGEDHKSGQPELSDVESFARLEEWARERWPVLGEVVYRWSGQVMEPSDGMAFIGRNPMDDDNVYVATGDSGNGMTHGTIAGMLISDLILGRHNPWEKLYEPGRVKLKTTPEFVKENANVAVQYVKGYMGAADEHSGADIAGGEGAVIRRGVKRIAVYRAENGEVHEMSAVCPHLGCAVAWNTTEKTWDCPCHGSRFACTGEVINGPANRNLEKVKHAVT